MSPSPGAICFLRDLPGTEWAGLAGGKGATLANLHRAGYPVPDGFVVLWTAFEGDALSPAARPQVLAGLAALRGGDAGATFAVRSSAPGEDSARDSFAGAFETVLDVSGDEDVLRAVERVRASRHSARAASYAASRGDGAEREMAVVVQRLVRTDVSGVLFTADPVSGDRGAMVGNAVRGLGERLVSGEATAPSFTLRRPRGAYAGPPELKRFARPLFRLGRELELALGGPQDIEWGFAGGRLALLQARPITTLRTFDPATGERNDSLGGDYLWTNANVGEALSDVMTPCTWSLVEHFFGVLMPMLFIGEHRPMGSIGGRLYLNLSLVRELGASLGMSARRMAAELEPVFGKVPEGLEVPRVRISAWRLFAGVLRHVRKVRSGLRRFSPFLADAPARCEALRARIAAAPGAGALLALWGSELLPFFEECSRMTGAAAWQSGDHGVKLRAALQRLVSDEDAAALCTHGSTAGNGLASLGPLLGLGRLARGEIDREAYVRAWGHRGPSELEVLSPRPGEDPEWLERLMAGVRGAPADATALLERQSERHAAARERLRRSHPFRARALIRRIDRLARMARDRELARSEIARVFWALRDFVRRAGALTGQGDAVFFLSFQEILALLRGDPSALEHVPARRATYERYRALPQLPGLIRGRFDPFRWAADPERRLDLYDARGGPASSPTAIAGFPGASGVVEGAARVLSSPAEGDQLQFGEILVTASTNIGWTPLFPRVAAIVTDVGAPLSHAAIVARELGIPAVVGCGNATSRLRTGDRVRVNGARGTVERLG